MEEENLLKETIEALKENGKTPKDVQWVGSKDGKYAISWEEFEKIADIEYDAGYGAPEIATDLVVVGDGWWLERWECEDAEGWAFKTLPQKQPDAKKFSRVKGCYETIAELNPVYCDECGAELGDKFYRWTDNDDNTYYLCSKECLNKKICKQYDAEDLISVQICSQCKRGAKFCQECGARLNDKVFCWMDRTLGQTYHFCSEDCMNKFVLKRFRDGYYTQANILKPYKKGGDEEK